MYVGFFIVVTISVFALISYDGYSYYNTPLDQRFFSPDHQSFRPSGRLGHAFGIIGSVFMITGVLVYMLRKRVKSLMRIGLLKHWLEFHIFLCTLGPILVLFHTAFKFGGIVSVSFWSMVIVFLSGIIGRFIYVRIPHTIEGQEMSMQQIHTLNEKLTVDLMTDYNLDSEIVSSMIEMSQIENKGKSSFLDLLFSILPNYLEKRGKIKNISKQLKFNNIDRANRLKIIRIIKEKISISNKIHYLRLMQSLFKYWHIAHLPFALIMLIIMFIHIIVTVSMGYRWIF
jgi:hypothetical protein